MTISPSLRGWLNSKGITRQELMGTCFVDGPGRDQLEQWESEARKREWERLQTQKGHTADNYSHSSALEARVQKQVRNQKKKFRYHTLTVRFLRGRFDRHVVTYDSRFFDEYANKKSGKARFGPSMHEKGNPHTQRHAFLPYPIEWAKTIIIEHCGQQVWDELNWNRESYHPADLWNLILDTPVIPLRIEEGYRKAVAASQEEPHIPVLGLGGITQWHLEAGRMTAPLRALAPGRSRVAVVFDHSEKKKNDGLTGEQFNARRIAEELKREGAEDVVFGVWGAGTKSTDERVENLRKVEQCCPDLFPEVGELLMELGHLPQMASPDDPARYDRMNYRPDLVVKGSPSIEDLVEAMKALPQKLVLVIEGRLGSGKTKVVIGGFMGLGAWSLFQGPTYRASLALSAAAKFKITTPSASKGEEERTNAGRPHRGCAYSMESGGRIVHDTLGEPLENLKWLAERLRSGEWSAENGRILLFLDEICQAVPNWLVGGTEQRVGSEVIQDLLLVMQHPLVDIIAADALVGDVEVDALWQITGIRPFILRSEKTWKKKVLHYSQRKTYDQAIQDALDDDGGIIHIAVPTKREARAWAKRAERAGRSTFLITGDTSQTTDVQKFFENPDAYLAKREPNLVVISTSALTSGVSIEETPCSAVFVKTGGFLDAEAAVQMSNRFRLASVICFFGGKMPPSAFYTGDLEIEVEDDALVADREASLVKMIEEMPAEFRGWWNRLRDRMHHERAHYNPTRIGLRLFQIQGYNVERIDQYIAKPSLAPVGPSETEEESAEGRVSPERFKAATGCLLRLGEISTEQVQELLQERNDNPVMLQQESPLRLYKTMGAHKRFTAALKADPDKRFYKDDKDLTKLAAHISDTLEHYDGRALRQWKEVTGIGKYYPEKGLSLNNVKKMLTALQLPLKEAATNGQRCVVIDWGKVEEYCKQFEIEGVAK